MHSPPVALRSSRRRPCVFWLVQLLARLNGNASAVESESSRVQTASESAVWRQLGAVDDCTNTDLCCATLRGQLLRFGTSPKGNDSAVERSAL